MTKTAIKRAFKELDATEQARLLGELASTLASSLDDIDRRDARVFDRRRKEEAKATPLADVRRRLAPKGRKRG